ncbi:MAG: hypothetical protein H6657_21940 [Ardenticatenaceae bacterium]|nr:hypothetical protein [Ardenticatenaceae bacterium]
MLSQFPDFPTETKKFPEILPPIGQKSGFANSSSPNKFLPDEPMFYSSNDIASVFFKKAQIATLYDERLTIVNESKYFQTPPSQSSSNEEDFLRGKELDQSIISAKNKPVKIRMFISDDGYKLNYLIENKANGQPISNEILLFIEGDDDTFSQKIIYAIWGKDVQFSQKSLQGLVKSQAYLTNDDVNQLLQSAEKGEKGFLDNLASLLSGIFYSFEFGFALLSNGLGKAIDFMENNLIVKESVWNPSSNSKKSNLAHDTVFVGIDKLLENAKIFFNNLNQSILNQLVSKNKISKPLASKLDQIFKYVTDIYESVITIHTKIVKAALEFSQHQLSFLIGVWNGLVDMISGLLFLVKLALDGGKLANKAVGDVIGFKNDKSSQREVLELLDNILDKFNSINIVEVFDNVIKASKSFISEIDLNAIINSTIEGAKNVGEGIEKGIEKGVKSALSLSSYEIFYYLGYAATLFIPVAWIASLLGKAGKAGRLLGNALKWVDDLAAKAIGIAIKGVKRAANPLVVVLKALAKKLQGGTKAIVKSIDEIIVGIKRWLDDIFPNWRQSQRDFDELLRQVDNLFDQSGGRLLTGGKLRGLRDILRSKYGVRLRFVDTDHNLKNLLKEWNSRNVVGKFNPGPPPEMFLRSNNASELTVFHEMAHLEVWYKKLPKMHIVDEEKYVFEAIWKARERWTNTEIIDSYDYVNRIVSLSNMRKGTMTKMECPI